MTKDPRQLGRFFFQDAAFAFQSLWRFGVIAGGGADLGEALTAASRVKDGDREGWYNSWRAMAEQVEGGAREFLENGHTISARRALGRATTYYRTAEIYLDPADPRQVDTWKHGRGCFLQMAQLSEGLIDYLRIPFEEGSLPAYFCRVDRSGQKRPLLIIHTGLDGTAEDLYFIIVPFALERGYNCLVFEGPGQGEMIRVDKQPFRPDWETVVTPVVDFALELSETDSERIGLLGYSMGGYLAPRAMAFEPRVACCVVDSGVYTVFDGVMSKFPAEVKEGVGDESVRPMINRTVADIRKQQPDLDQFIGQMLWTFQADSPFDLFEKLAAYTIADVIDKIRCPMLVIGSVHDQVAGSYEQAKIFFEALEQPNKTYYEFSSAEGAQFHCQSGAPNPSSEHILNWFDERLEPLTRTTAKH
jgi:alpha-beta hydrolase superfamily lysophospholipase